MQPSMRKVLQKIGGKKRQDLDACFEDAHETAFANIDCLTCANCCKTTGPRLNTTDIDRIASHLGMQVSAFSDKYVQIDEDGDRVMTVLPCPFLEEDNACSIYEVRPKACRTYPHTDRRKQRQLFNLHLKNLEVCPAVQSVLQEITERLAQK